MSEIPEPVATQTELTYEQAMQFATQLHRRGELAAAERLYRTLREAVPTDPNPTHYLGVLLHQRGRGEEGLALIRESIQADPNVASWHNNLGNVMLDAGQMETAAAAYTRCTELDPNNFEVLNNLGVMLRGMKRYTEAEEAFQRALEKNPTFANAHTNLASLYYETKRIKEGHEHIAAVLALEPGDPVARKVLGMLYASIGRLDDAARIFREWLQHEPNSEQAKHHLAACTREAMPERASEGYVEQVFDSFAGSFDAKLATLEYRAPGLIGEKVAKLLSPASSDLHILDAGCGTGLCGPYLQQYAGRLVGVDLSGNMLERARVRGHYHQLIKADLVAYLKSCDASHHLIVSADTLCYFGRLDEFVSASQRALLPGGRLVFTVEAHADGPEFQLNPNGRYSHRRDYVLGVLREASFDQVEAENVILRNEAGQPVHGWIISGQKPKA